MVSDESRVRAVSAAILVYALLVVAGIMTGAISAAATPYCVSVPCVVTAAWYLYIAWTSDAPGYRWGLVASAIGWALVGVAFVSRQRGHLPITFAAAFCILLGGLAGVLAFRPPAR